MQQPKISLSTVDGVLRGAEEAPALHESEVTKTEAMRRLIPAVRALQAKGYGLSQIARFFSDKGVAVTEVTLKHYMHRHGGRSVAETSRTPRRDRASTGGATVPSPKQVASPRPALPRAATAPPTVERPNTNSPATSHSPASDGASSVPSESARRAIPAAATEPSPLRGGFVVRPDRAKI
jgi:hypothetical protein